MGKALSKRGEVLVALVNNWTDWGILRNQLWYRVPVKSAPKRWPPRWLAFYQTKNFGEEAYKICYFGQVKAIKRVLRNELFPDELPNAKSEQYYYQIFLDALEVLPRPIISRLLRRVVFISTTYYKLVTAEEINDLYDDSPLEDALWIELKRLHLFAERQYNVKTGDARYVLDFALFCVKGSLDIETDGDRWHADPARIPQDNRRNNALAADRWSVLRFNTHQIREEMAEYCVPQIAETVNQLGGVDGQASAPRRYYPTENGMVQQLSLFESSVAYDVEPPDGIE